MKSYVAVVSLVLALFCGIIPLNCQGTHASKRPAAKYSQRKATVMSADVRLNLFDIRTYKERVLPAYQSFFKKDDTGPLIALLRECIQKLDADPQLAEHLLWNSEVIEEDIGILKGTVHYTPDGKSSNQGETEESHKVRRDYAREFVSSNILQILCVPRDKRVNPEQEMTNTPLITYLYEKSGWIKDVFTFSRSVQGGRLELTMGESSELFTKEDIQKFSAELNKVPPPEDRQLRKEYDDLRAMVNIALEDPNLTLVISVG